MPRKKIGIAMSGGVDSTVAALLLRKEGYEVHGFFMQLPLEERAQQIQRVTEVARAIDVPLTLVDMQEHFSCAVINNFVSRYQQGQTPNPCVLCNKIIKFGVLLETILSHGMDKGATGHYARIEHDQQGQYNLLRGVDPKKDQSYFLCQLEQKQLAKSLFPLGLYQKDEVYAQAKAFGLTGFSGLESQDVCFLSSGLQEFLAAQGVEEKIGEIRSVNGEILGHHSGISHYTIGQRRGLGIPDATPWYVTRLDSDQNLVIVGKNDDLFQQKIIINHLHWVTAETTLPWQGLVQLRSRHRPTPARLEQTNGNQWVITCAEPQRAITPGQFAVFYEESRVAGSGIIKGATS